MKTLKPALLLVISFFLCASCAGKETRGGASKIKNESASKIASFKSSEDWKKLDGRFRKAWEDAIKKGDDEKRFECLLKTNAKPTRMEKKHLAEAGYESRSVTRRIFTGSVAAKDVPKVAALPFVKVMELAVPMSLK